MNHKLNLENIEEPEIKMPRAPGSQKKQENSTKKKKKKKASISASLTTLKPLTAWITANCGNFYKR